MIEEIESCFSEENSIGEESNEVGDHLDIDEAAIMEIIGKDLQQLTPEKPQYDVTSVVSEEEFEPQTANKDLDHAKSQDAIL